MSSRYLSYDEFMELMNAYPEYLETIEEMGDDDTSNYWVECYRRYLIDCQDGLC